MIKAKHVKFQNSQLPRSGFDMIKLQTLYQRVDLDHSISDNHIVEFYILLLILEGTGTHTVDFKEYKYGPGSVFTIRKDQIQKFHPNATTKGFLLLFTNEFLVSFFQAHESQKTEQLFNELLGSPHLVLNKKRFLKTKKQLKRIKEEYFVERDDHSLAIIRSELQILIARLFRIKSKEENTLHSHKHLASFIKFQRMVEQNATNKHRVQEYAQQLGVSTKSLNKITQTTIHKSAKEFLDEVHLKQIKRLLINSKASIKEIAYQVGFDEPSNFYKFFKRHTKQTPEQFRSELQ